MSPMWASSSVSRGPRTTRASARSARLPMRTLILAGSDAFTQIRAFSAAT